ncbi:TIGR02611 family protein [Streptomyces olivochromogenes]|uniref:TIGR02611 family protein n=1 Tax=Streptomyces olivochromogenes TaxID=1963 RepID=UPI001F309A98|nr:TIGR02611 family protein [Streptomyces olivochromogenes]MCF3135513.1 TIGR02611 family protein [Streptomyces olivochromogenes]
MNTGSNGAGEIAAVSDEVKADGVKADVARDERGLGSRAPEFIKARRALHVSWQVGVFVVGLAVVGVGIVMLPLPGPGWVVIFGGMAIWATEFVWAQLVLRWTKRKVTEAAQRALDPKVRRRNIALTVIGLVIVAVLVGIYLWKFGMVMPWKLKDQ